MDKSWMQNARCSPEYIRGCLEFLKFAWKHRRPEFRNLIYCPCVQCINHVLRPIEEVKEHILEQNRIMQTYVHWTEHGEDVEVNLQVETQVLDDGDAPRAPNLVDRGDDKQIESRVEDPNDENELLQNEENGEVKKFNNFLEESQTHPSSACSKSSEQLQIKELQNKMSNMKMKFKGVVEEIKLLKRQMKELDEKMESIQQEMETREVEFKMWVLSMIKSSQLPSQQQGGAH